jgi:carnitine 3-dehydrogenase
MDALYRRLGLDEGYRRQGRMFYTAESHVRHLREAKVGDRLYVTTQVVRVEAKSLHVFHRLHRTADGALIATAEQMHVHVDTAAARAAPVDAALRTRLDALAAAHAAFGVPDGVGQPVASRAQR